MEQSRATWITWFQAWYASHWTPSDLPSLEVTILLWDQVRCRGDYTRAPELRMREDTWGISPKGQQDRRWSPPETDAEPVAMPSVNGRYAHLKVV